MEVVRGDLTAPETLERALDDVEAIFLVWMAPLAAAAPAIERIAPRLNRTVFLSSPIRTNHPFFQQPNRLRHVHAGVDDLIEKSGTPWTILRPGPFALNCRNWWAPQIRHGDVVRWFHGAAQTAAVHERDIAAVAVRALTDQGHENRDYVLTGPESLTQREQLAIIGDVIGRNLVFDDVSPDTARQDVLAAWPAPVADMLLSAYAAAVRSAGIPDAGHRRGDRKTGANLPGMGDRSRRRVRDAVAPAYRLHGWRPQAPQLFVHVGCTNSIRLRRRADTRV